MPIIVHDNPRLEPDPNLDPADDPYYGSLSENFDNRVDGIRRLVAIGISETNDLTDEDIEDDAFLGRANRAMARRIPDWKSITGDNRKDLEVSVQKLCAAELLKSTARPIDLDAATARDRQIYLEIKDTIESFLADVASIISEIEPNISSKAQPYFCVIDPLSYQ